MNKTLEKAKNGAELSRADALELLAIPVGSEDYYALLYAANAESRARFGGRGVIFAQIGIEASPCPANCGFCSLAADVFPKENSFALPVEAACATAERLAAQKVDEHFLMTTANYPQSNFLAYAKQVRAHIPDDMRFVANVGDFNLDYARELRAAGFTGVYHIRRLGAGGEGDVGKADLFFKLEGFGGRLRGRHGQDGKELIVLPEFFLKIVVACHEGVGNLQKTIAVVDDGDDAAQRHSPQHHQKGGDAKSQTAKDGAGKIVDPDAGQIVEQSDPAPDGDALFVDCFELLNLMVFQNHCFDRLDSTKGVVDDLVHGGVVGDDLLGQLLHLGCKAVTLCLHYGCFMVIFWLFSGCQSCDQNP